MRKFYVIFQYFVFLFIAFASNFNYGFSTTYVNTSADEFKNYLNASYHFQLTESQYELVWNIFLNFWFIGFFIGIWVSPILNERFGRKVGFLVGNLTAFLAAVARCAAVYWRFPIALIIARFVTSICMAVTYQSCILFLQECSPTHRRGHFSFFSEISYSSMTMIGSLLGTDYILGTHLVWLTACVVPFCFVFTILLLFLPDTPKYLLITRNDEVEACRSVRFYHGDEADAKQVLLDIRMEAECESSDDSTTLTNIKDLFIHSHLRLALILSVSALQNTVGFWALLLSSTFFLENANLDLTIAQWSTTAMLLAYVVGTLTGGVLIERFARRHILLAFTFINNIALLAFVFFAKIRLLIDAMKFGCLASLIFYGFTYGTGVGPISWFICSELVPQRYRTSAQSVSYAINTIMVVISTFTVLPLYSAIGSYAFVILYSVPSFISMLILFRWLPETKGREIYEIVNELKSK
ncbi:unnamed protein product [Caenorhabditis bovis]|uniref:Major facilitator superfamily (MFS) profile domain-containing protein n=1 Tax=Caenorhabditis bovis TaxID=2654633 RepID=A0A8S1EZK9_9PELO|nr:unnamed protein product [Caenorhabditis bovis]